MYIAKLPTALVCVHEVVCQSNFVRTAIVDNVDMPIWLLGILASLIGAYLKLQSYLLQLIMCIVFVVSYVIAKFVGCVFDWRQYLIIIC